MKPTALIYFARKDFALADFSNETWETSEEIALTKYWSGAVAPPERHATARLLWTDRALYGRFDCAQNEPPNQNENPQTGVETPRLWERDVCEIFVAPDKLEPEKYFEFEIAPTGEWLDYRIWQLSTHRETDTSFDSGIKTAQKIQSNSFTVTFKIEWQAFGKKPAANDEWAGNLLRCVGAHRNRGYLAWQPTLTEQPDFHVPAAFGTFKFIG